jgi:hypothetical protein
MVPPFSREEFLWSFGVYNLSVWPAQLVLLALAVIALGLGRQRGLPGPAGWILALLWAWMAIFYHAGVFSTVTPAAFLFAGLFLAQAALLASVAAGQPTPLSRPGPLARGVGWALVLYSLVAYPLIGLAVGHRYPFAPTLGVPCPTTIFTLGLFVLSARRVPRRLLVVPCLWALIGAGAAIHLGMVEDLMLPLSAFAALAVVVLRDRAPGRPDPASRGQHFALS